MEAERRILAGLPPERYDQLVAALRQLLLPYDDAARIPPERTP